MPYSKKIVSIAGTVWRYVAPAQLGKGDTMNVLDTLINKLLAEQPQYGDISIPGDMEDKKRLFRSLVNVRPPMPVDDDFLHMQDNHLHSELAEKGFVRVEQLKEIQPCLYLWQGDITRLNADAIVNAANSAMLGCFVPCHGCIDNAIHSFAGVQLRLKCHELMQEQEQEEPTGTAKITPAYNLPSRYVLHTVGPIIQGRPTRAQCEQLANCYRSCFELADNHTLKSIAFCCISTGEFHFPNRMAAEIAIQTVRDCLQTAKSIDRVIFNVYKEEDYAIYRRLLTVDNKA
jgi:O-acetyl-ADP-ribose deacetylase (regulator of RNase III)